MKSVSALVNEFHKLVVDLGWQDKISRVGFQPVYKALEDIIVNIERIKDIRLDISPEQGEFPDKQALRLKGLIELIMKDLKIAQQNMELFKKRKAAMPDTINPLLAQLAEISSAFDRLTRLPLAEIPKNI